MRGKAYWKTREPDHVDVNHIAAAVGEEFNLLLRWELRCEGDYTTIICRGLRCTRFNEVEVMYQALARLPIRSTKSISSQLYLTGWDVWKQADAESPLAGRKAEPRSLGGWRREQGT